MGQSTYWNQSFRRSFSRRTLLLRGGQAGAAAVGVTTLAGCSTTAQTPTSTGSTNNPTAAAGSPAAAAAASPATTGAPKYGGSYVDGDPGDASHLDPHISADNIQFTGRGPGNAYGRLLTFNASPSRKGPEIVAYGELADSWTQADDMTYIFKLKPGVKWQNIAPVNGREVVADDVAYSFDRQTSLKANAGGLGNYASSQAVDKYTLKVTTSKPDADFPAELAHYSNVIVAKEAVDLKGDLKEGPTIGFGPWILDKWEHDNITVLKKNPDYLVKGVPYLDTCTYRRIADEQTRNAAFRTGDLTVSGSGLGRLDLEEFKKSAIPNLQITASKLLGVGMEMVFQTTHKPFDDVRVRRAFSMGVDRQDILTRVQKKFGDAYWMVGPFVPDETWLLPEDEVKNHPNIKYNPDMAKKLLQDAGVPDGFSVDIYNLIFNDQYSEPAEAVAAQLKKIGVNATVKKVDTGAWVQNIHFGAQFDMNVGPIFPAQPMNGDLYIKYHSNGSRWSNRFKDDKLDKMIDDQAGMKDTAQRKKAAMDLQRYLLDVLPVVALYGFIGYSAVQPYVRGVQPFLGGGEWMQNNYLWFDK